MLPLRVTAKGPGELSELFLQLHVVYNYLNKQQSKQNFPNKTKQLSNRSIAGATAAVTELL
jgi:hypothetical protein